jgi:uncharacterized coiled-coil protein SlyX|nr:MAG TPA: Protein of unknown function (DUF2730) [Caudoviricetes sp.]
MELYEWIVQFAGYLLYLAGFVGAVGVAASWIQKIFAAARKPHKDLEERVDKLEEHNEHQDGCLKRDNNRLATIESDIRLVLKANMQLIIHELDGNHVDKLAEVRDAIHDHLIER